jgi:hypothetical protein
LVEDARLVEVPACPSIANTCGKFVSLIVRPLSA